MKKAFYVASHLSAVNLIPPTNNIKQKNDAQIPFNAYVVRFTLKNSNHSPFTSSLQLQSYDVL